MKLKSLFCLLAGFAPAVTLANWLNVGKVDYNWGPFHVYTISLYTETGNYTPNIRPLMLSLQYAKPVEGKNFAITLIKEIENLKIEGLDIKATLNTLSETLPDFHPNDTLSYIALPDKGYFVLNDTILNTEFDAAFNDAFISIWLSPKGSFARLQNKLLGQADTRVPTAEAVAKLSAENSANNKITQATTEPNVSTVQQNPQPETTNVEKIETQPTTNNTNVTTPALLEQENKITQPQPKESAEKTENINPVEEQAKDSAHSEAVKTEANATEKATTQHVDAQQVNSINTEKTIEIKPEGQDKKDELAPSPNNNEQTIEEKTTPDNNTLPKNEDKKPEESRPDVIPPDQENADPELLQKPVLEKKV